MGPCAWEFTGEVLKTPVSEDMLGRGLHSFTLQLNLSHD